MSDGPNYHDLFVGMQCLNAEANLNEIVSWLRFYKGQGNYQGFLLHYLPMLPKNHLDEFIEDVENPEIKQDILSRWSAKHGGQDIASKDTTVDIAIPDAAEVTPDPIAVRKSELKALSVAQLEPILKKLGLPLEGKKSAKVAAILAAEFPTADASPSA